MSGHVFWTTRHTLLCLSEPDPFWQNYLLGWLKRQHSLSEVEMWPFRILAGTSANMTEILLVFFSHSRRMPELRFNLLHDRLLSDHSQFNII
jgi:hypothetical protein